MNGTTIDNSRLIYFIIIIIYLFFLLSSYYYYSVVPGYNINTRVEEEREREY